MSASLAASCFPCLGGIFFSGIFARQEIHLLTYVRQKCSNEKYVKLELVHDDKLSRYLCLSNAGNKKLSFKLIQ